MACTGRRRRASQQSPLGEAVAVATPRGYRVGSGEPFHGYYYKILTRQGPKAPGGAHDYVVKGKMIGGFALIAWPAEYGNSGITTFMINHDGVVYEKDLGEDTSKIASRDDRIQSGRYVEEGRGRYGGEKIGSDFFALVRGPPRIFQANEFSQGFN